MSLPSLACSWRLLNVSDSHVVLPYPVPLSICRLAKLGALQNILSHTQASIGDDPHQASSYLEAWLWLLLVDDLSLFLFLVWLGGGCGCGCRSRPHRSPVLSEPAPQIVLATNELHSNRVGDGTIVSWCEYL